MVVLVDGRSVYSPLFSGVFWDAVDLVLADVDRIEVIRGAGGTLWGANAVNGVINIITRLASDTQGALLEFAGGSDVGILSARCGGKVGSSGHYRIYGKARELQSMPYQTGVDPDEDLTGLQSGVRFDFGDASRTSFMLRADGYRNHFAIFNAEDGRASGFDVVGRLRRTFGGGSQLQFQFYYDTTYRRVPVQYAERRHTGDLDLQYATSLGKRHHLVSGVGFQLTHDRVTPTATFGFEPSSRTSPLLNVFIQDDITLVTGRFGAVTGVKIEHNDFTGFEYQPTFRLKWTPSSRQMVWGGVSRAVRMPTRIDSDLRFTAGTPFVVISGNPDFQSETVIATEIGYRARIIPRTAFGVTTFVNSYDDLRSQEPTPPLGIPIVIGNKENARVGGVEAAVTVEPVEAWQLHVSYSRLVERFSYDADSRDPTGGALEHNDPPHQLRLRSYTDLPGHVSLDLTMRWVDALPKPAVPAYAELTIRVARPLGRQLELELVGDNLLHDRHLEFVNLGPPHAVPRSVFARVTWRSR
jgi:iron complex outermembrane receptor protein